MNSKLTPAQLKRLREIIQPLIDEEVKAAVDEMRGGGTNYAERILNGKGGDAGTRRGTGDLSATGRVLARLGMIAAVAGPDRSLAQEMARALDIEEQYKAAQSAGSAAGGGLLIADAMAADVIELLRPFSVVRRIGALEVPLPAGNRQMPKITVGVSSGYVAEGKAIPTSSLKTGAINMIARKLATIVVLTNELAAFSQGQQSFNADQIVLNDMLASIGQTEDVKFLRGAGSEAEPLGIVNQAAATNLFDATQAGAAATLDEVQADLQKAENLLLSADVPMQRPVWILSPRSRLFLRDIRDTQDRGVFGEEMSRSRTINGYSYFQSNNIPNNLGTGNDESLVILVDAAQVLIGDVNQVVVDRSDSATLKIDGVDTNIFEHDMRALRVRRWNDILLRHDVAVAVIEAVKWGA
jgi:HK97 family phage major capsid protein